jgi:hypothetical protein
MRIEVPIAAAALLGVSCCASNQDREPYSLRLQQMQNVSKARAEAASMAATQGRSRAFQLWI